MQPTDGKLGERVAALETRMFELQDVLRAALEYVSSDPASSLTKSRMVLEKIVVRRFEAHGAKAPSRAALAEILCNKAFTAGVPRRILARMNAIREMGNLGSHGEEVLPDDAARAMRDLIDVVDWRLATSGPEVVMSTQGPRRSKEIFPRLKARYPRDLREEIVSVQFLQSPSRCWLEVTTRDPRNEFADEVAKRSDLGFIVMGSDGPMFESLVRHRGQREALRRRAGPL